MTKGYHNLRRLRENIEMFEPDRVFSRGAALVSLHLGEVDLGGFGPQAGLPHGVALGVADADRAVLAPQRQEVLRAPRSTRNPLRVLANDGNFPVKLSQRTDNHII